MTVGYGCELCIRDEDLLVCTERCTASTQGYTETERAARLGVPPEYDRSGHGHGTGIVGCPECEDLDD